MYINAVQTALLMFFDADHLDSVKLKDSGC